MQRYSKSLGSEVLMVTGATDALKRVRQRLQKEKISSPSKRKNCRPKVLGARCGDNFACLQHNPLFFILSASIHVSDFFCCHFGFAVRVFGPFINIGARGLAVEPPLHDTKTYLVPSPLEIWLPNPMVPVEAPLSTSRMAKRQKPCPSCVSHMVF
jgi:hypothetical protein